MPTGVLLDTLAWQVAQCLTQCALPQPIAVIRQTIRDLLVRQAVVSAGGLVLNRNFWRRVAKKSRCSGSVGASAKPLGVFGEKFDSSVFYDPEGSVPTKRGKTFHGYGVKFLADLRFGLV